MNKELDEKLKNIDLKKCKKECNNYFNKFDEETDHPKRCVRDKLGQFIGVGKLKVPTDHLGKGANEVTIQSAHISDHGNVIPSRWDIRHDELIILRNYCDFILNEWNS